MISDYTEGPAASSTFAEHYVQCDNCDENPAQNVCKSCPGHLCDECKTEHERRKITKNHKLTTFRTDNEELLDVLYCSEHGNKKMSM